MEHRRELEDSGVDTTIPYTVDENGRLHPRCARVSRAAACSPTPGERGDATDAVIDALTAAGMLIARAG
jgi:isoleucyl-tRNA synthetase